VIDDLKLIRGVGPVEEIRMQQSGVYRFWQIANWSPAHVSEISLKCGFADRVQRENWIPQASNSPSSSACIPEGFLSGPG